MKKALLFLFSATILLTTVFALGGCSQLDLPEQPDPVVIYAEKIYPSAVGNYLTDASVNIPAIEAYMKEYNKNADSTAQINYTSIKYNKDADYYYVNDNKTAVGMKFKLDSSMSIVSASIYTGALDQTTKNVYNVVINAIEVSGYKSLMTDEDRAIIQHTLNGINSVENAKQEVQQLFNGQENFAAKWESNMAEFEIPVKPTELPKPDTSHKLVDVVMPTVEVPTITLDTTIVEGTHLSNGTEVKPQDISDIANKIQDANKDIAQVQEYNKTSPESVNSLMNSISINAQLKNTDKKIVEAGTKIKELQDSAETKDLSVTKTLTSEFNEMFKNFQNETMPKPDNSNSGVIASASDFFAEMEKEGYLNKEPDHKHSHIVDIHGNNSNGGGGTKDGFENLFYVGAPAVATNLNDIVTANQYTKLSNGTTTVMGPKPMVSVINPMQGVQNAVDSSSPSSIIDDGNFFSDGTSRKSPAARQKALQNGLGIVSQFLQDGMNSAPSNNGNDAAFDAGVAESERQALITELNTLEAELPALKAQNHPSVPEIEARIAQIKRLLGMTSSSSGGNQRI